MIYITKVMIFLHCYWQTLQIFMHKEVPLKIGEPSALWKTNNEECVRKPLLPIPLW